MTVHHVSFDGRRVEVRDGETLLQALCRQRVHLPYYCQIGSCKTCLVRAVDGPPPAGSQIELLPEQVERGCFLACAAYLDRDLTVERLPELS